MVYVLQTHWPSMTEAEDPMLGYKTEKVGHYPALRASMSQFCPRGVLLSTNASSIVELEADALVLAFGVPKLRSCGG